MALIFTAGGDAVTLDHYNIRYSTQKARLNVGQGPRSGRGSVFGYYGQRDGPQMLRVTGLHKGTSGTNLDTLLDDLTKVLNTGKVLLEDTERDRFAVVHKIGFRRAFLAPYLYKTEAELVMVDGHWTEDPDDGPNLTSAVVNSTKLVRYVHVTYDGSAAAYPKIDGTLNTGGGGTNWAQPQIEWRGRNLVKNSSFEDGVDFPDDWTVTGGGEPDARQHIGRSGSRCVRTHHTGGVYYALYQLIEIDASTDYIFSIYARKVSANGDFDTYLQWRDAADATISQSSASHTATSSNWTRFTVTGTSPATAAFVRMRCDAINADEVYLDDAQLEKGTAATEYVNTNDPENKHVSFERKANGSWSAIDTGGAGSPDQWAVDMELGRTRVISSGDWVEDNHTVNGHVFDLCPGLNHLFVSAPSSGDVTVEVNHPDLWF